ncbi:hypothetical protein [Nitrososphaera sp.]|uniref:hypothetical protein n=1 Tax=Nitrososphaera sp. TaxID=1971748 RepID=UPI00307ECFB2
MPPVLSDWELTLKKRIVVTPYLEYLRLYHNAYTNLLFLIADEIPRYRSDSRCRAAWDNIFSAVPLATAFFLYAALASRKRISAEKGRPLAFAAGILLAAGQQGP